MCDDLPVRCRWQASFEAFRRIMLQTLMHEHHCRAHHPRQELCPTGRLVHGLGPSSLRGPRRLDSRTRFWQTALPERIGSVRMASASSSISVLPVTEFLRSIHVSRLPVTNQLPGSPFWIVPSFPKIVRKQRSNHRACQVALTSSRSSIRLEFLAQGSTPAQLSSSLAPGRAGS